MAVSLVCDCLSCLKPSARAALTSTFFAVCAGNEVERNGTSKALAKPVRIQNRLTSLTNTGAARRARFPDRSQPAYDDAIQRSRGGGYAFTARIRNCWSTVRSSGRTD